jgi:hypothetical protein
MRTLAAVEGLLRESRREIDIDANFKFSTCLSLGVAFWLDRREENRLREEFGLLGRLILGPPPPPRPSFFSPLKLVKWAFGFYQGNTTYQSPQ